VGCKTAQNKQKRKLFWSSYFFSGAGTSAFCSSDTYRGSAAFSAPETAALRDAAFGADSPYIRAFFSVHCYSEFMLVPYGYTSTKPARYTHLVRFLFYLFHTFQNENNLKAARLQMSQKYFKKFNL
jgi:hypothetical protein